MALSQSSSPSKRRLKAVISPHIFFIIATSLHITQGVQIPKRAPNLTPPAHSLPNRASSRPAQTAVPNKNLHDRPIFNAFTNRSTNHNHFGSWYNRKNTIAHLYRGDSTVDSESESPRPSFSSSTKLSERNDETIVDLEVKSKSKSLLLFTAVTALSLVSIAAKMGLFVASSLGEAYTNDLIIQDAGATVLTAILAGVFVKLCTSQGDWISPRDSRKLVHTFSGPLFIMVWPLFSNNEGARFFAAVVPLINAARLYIAGTGKGGDESELARAVSRSGEAKEALEGPFVYVIVLIISTVLWWRNNLTGIIAISTMAGGDGMADLIGRRFGKNNKWPFSPSKSVAGTLAFFVASTLTSMGLLSWLGCTGCLELPFDTFTLFLRIVLIELVCSIVELLPLGNDNWSVPISAAILSGLLLNS